MNAATRRHIGRVKELACCLCGDMGIEAHHIGGITTGKRDECSWAVIPLCPGCHRGPKGVHGDKTMLRIVKKTEIELLSETLEKIYGNLK